MEIKVNQKSSLANANLWLLEVLINDVINSKDVEQMQSAVNDLANFMNNKTSEGK